MINEKEMDFSSFSKALNEEIDKENQQLSELLEKVASKGKEQEKQKKQYEDSLNSLNYGYQKMVEKINLQNLG